MSQYGWSLNIWAVYLSCTWELEVFHILNIQNQNLSFDVIVVPFLRWNLCSQELHNSCY